MNTKANPGAESGELFLSQQHNCDILRPLGGEKEGTPTIVGNMRGNSMRLNAII